MSSSPDLFVVCKNCGSEVSPYVTECPYCGQRVRKRAPKLERDDSEGDPRPKEPRRPKLPSLPKLSGSPGIAGIAPDTRPVVTLALISVALIVTVVLAASDAIGYHEIGALTKPFDDQPWRFVSTLFVYGDNRGYQFAALVVTGIFGTLIERRFGWFAPLFVFLVAGAAGAAAASYTDLGPAGSANGIYAVLGANGAALGLLFAWLADDRLAARRGDDRGNDLIAVAVLALVLLLMPLAVLDANPLAGVVGALVGAVLGALLSSVRRA